MLQNKGNERKKILANFLTNERKHINQNPWKRLALYGGILCLILSIIYALLFKTLSAGLLMIISFILIIFSTDIEYREIAIGI